MSYDQTQVAFIDTETTGLDPERCHIWEIAVIVDGVEHCWHQNWPSSDGGREGVPDWDAVDPWVLENTGIKDRFPGMDEAIHPIHSFERFASLVQGRHLVGACPWFDSERLHRIQLGWANWGGMYGRDLPWHYHLVDVENLAVGYLAGVSAGAGDGYRNPVEGLPWKSTDLSSALGINPDDFEPKHSALADARWAKAMYEAIMGGPA